MLLVRKGIMFVMIVYFAKALYLLFLCLTINCLFLNKNSRVIAFLTGAPDYEDGQLDTKRYGE